MPLSDTQLDKNSQQSTELVKVVAYSLDAIINGNCLREIALNFMYHDSTVRHFQLNWSLNPILITVKR